MTPRIQWIKKVQPQTVKYNMRYYISIIANSECLIEKRGPAHWHGLADSLKHCRQYCYQKENNPHKHVARATEVWCLSDCIKYITEHILRRLVAFSWEIAMVRKELCQSRLVPSQCRNILLLKIPSPPLTGAVASERDRTESKELVYLIHNADMHQYSIGHDSVFLSLPFY